MAENKNKLVKRILIALAALLAVLAIAAAWYVNDVYPADEQALAAIADADGPADGVEVRQLPGGEYAFVPAHPLAGLVFYPGAKVQPEAYAPLMEQCAEQGILCVLLKPTFNLAILDMDAADGTYDLFPEIDTWLAAGHSMGGVAAADYAARHDDSFDGIVLLASYPASSLADFDGKVLSIAGSNDTVLNRQKYENAKTELPAGAREVLIEGGNHANFGNYGDQAGDTQADIDRAEQQAQTADAIAECAHTFTAK